MIAARMAQLQRQHGVDLRCGMTVTSRRAMIEDACAARAFPMVMHVAVPAFSFNQFGINIKSVGVPTGADEVMIAQGSLEEACCVAVYGKNARLVAAVNQKEVEWISRRHARETAQVAAAR